MCADTKLVSLDLTLCLYQTSHTIQRKSSKEFWTQNSMGATISLAYVVYKWKPVSLRASLQPPSVSLEEVSIIFMKLGDFTGTISSFSHLSILPCGF